MVVKSNISKELEDYAKLPYTVIVEQWDDGKDLIGLPELQNSLTV